MQKRTLTLLIIFAALIAVVAIAVVVGRGKSGALAVKTQKIALSTFDTKLPESGVIQHPGTQTIPAMVAGNLGHIYVRAGDRVSAGQLLATIDNPTLESNAAGSSADYESAVANVSSAQVNSQNAKVQYEAAVATAKSTYDEARRVYEADVNLFNNKAIARNQVDADRAKMDQAKVQYDQAVRQLQLGAVSGYGQNSVQFAKASAIKSQILNEQSQQQLAYTHIVAPFSGVIQTVATQPTDALRTLQPGDPITQGQAIFTIASGNGFIVKAQVDEQDIIDVRVGQRVVVSGEDFPNHHIAGHVADISPVAVRSTDASSTSKQILTTVALDSSPPYLKDGMSADLDIYTAHIPGVIVVPDVAVLKDRKGSYVWAIVGGHAVRRPVKTGASNDSQTVIAAGLHVGDVIVAEKNPVIVDGMALKPAPAASFGPGQ